MSAKKETPPVEGQQSLEETIEQLQGQLNSQQQEIQIYVDQIKALETFSNIVVGQRNEAQTEIARLQTQVQILQSRQQGA